MRLTEARLTLGNLKLDDVYEWWARQIDKPVSEFDDRERQAAVNAYTANLRDMALANAPDKKQKQERRRKPRRGRWQ